MDEIKVGDLVICTNCRTLVHRVGKIYKVSDALFYDPRFTIMTTCGKLFMISEVVKITKAQIYLYQDEE